ncbi:MAG: hypothetical protein CMF26_06970 [Kiloniella sp.]|jgi:hypothetical protein|nr:hypothetical protein [Kiloniella sp.]
MKIASLFNKLSVIATGTLASILLASTAQAGLNDLRGAWINVDENTRGITKVVIGGEGASATLNTWGACHPSDCNWGEVAAMPLASSVSASPLSADRIMAHYSKSHATSLISAYMHGDALIIENATDFNDGRTDTFFRYTLKRMPVSIPPILMPNPILPLLPLLPVSPIETNLEQMEGAWMNIDDDTRGVTKIRVLVNGSTVRVKAWGSCHPTDCNWGWTQGIPLTASVGADPTSAERIMATWDQGFAKRTMVLKRRGQKLIAEMTTVYTDGRSDRFNTYILR